jgi:hypothetical protein
MIRSLDAAKLQARMAEWLARPPENMRGALQEWANTNGVAIS